MAEFVKGYATKHGLTVEDAKHDLVVSVTATDCKRGERNNPEGCAIARCILATKPEYKRAFIFRSTAYVETARRLVRFKLPELVQREVANFDKFGVMEPGIYKLQAPGPGHTIDYHKQYEKQRKPKVRRKIAGAPKRMHQADKIRVGRKAGVE